MEELARSMLQRASQGTARDVKPWCVQNARASGCVMSTPRQVASCTEILVVCFVQTKVQTNSCNIYIYIYQHKGSFCACALLAFSDCIATPSGVVLQYSAINRIRTLNPRIVVMMCECIGVHTRDKPSTATWPIPSPSFAMRVSSCICLVR